uniref:Uncharacterized protein n=1 Tax=viral metagenome TaxID=1070528 RepID=A0A6M3LYV4_9ZZZZ
MLLPELLAVCILPLRVLLAVLPVACPGTGMAAVLQVMQVIQPVMLAVLLLQLRASVLRD